MPPPLNDSGPSRARQRVRKPAPDLTVPDIQEDAAERKRVLGVLAQRRYRQRKREARLGARALPQGSKQSPEAPQLGVPSQSGGDDALVEPSVEPAADLGEVTDLGDSALGPLELAENIQPLPSNPIPNPFDTAQPDQALLQWLASNSADGDTYPADSSNPPLSLYCSPNEADVLPLLPDDLFNNNIIPGNTPPYSTANLSLATYLPPSTSSTIPPASDDTTTSANTAPTASRTGTPFGSSPTTPASPSGISLSTDSYHLTVPVLTLLRGLVRIATRLNAIPSAFSLDAASPFTSGAAPTPAALPPAWQPTTTQLLIPHHPVLDLLPWPGVRDRLIGFMNLEMEMDINLGVGHAEPGVAGQGDGRGGAAATTAATNEGHPSGASPTGSRLVDFIYDMEDTAEGLMIWGPDPYDEAGWEVGQLLFERWWFVFDQAVVERSNRLRRQRGAPPLRALGWR